MIATLLTMPQTKESSISRTPSLASGLDAFGLSNQAQSLARSGDLVGAERLQLQALDVKIKGFGFQSPQAASTLHSLAEVQIRLGKLSDAEQNVRSAISIRASSSKQHDLSEAAKSRELLAQILESTGNLSSAKSVRLSGQPDWIACGNSKVTFFFPFRIPSASLTVFAVPGSMLQHRTIKSLWTVSVGSILLRRLPGMFHLRAFSCFFLTCARPEIGKPDTVYIVAQHKLSTSCPPLFF
jgi:hypothetical protein